MKVSALQRKIDRYRAFAEYYDGKGMLKQYLYWKGRADAYEDVYEEDYPELKIEKPFSEYDFNEGLEWIAFQEKVKYRA